MKHRSRLALVASVVALIGATAAPPAASAEALSGPAIVYSDTYLKLIAEFPSGWVSNGCEISAFLAGGGVCTADWDPVAFYPDGTSGHRAWFVDPSSPTGWSVEPDPTTELCADVTNLDYETWAGWVDAQTYPEFPYTGPALTADDIECGAATWGVWV